MMSATGHAAHLSRFAHYRRYAEEMREVAAVESDATRRDTLLRLAGEYDALAAAEPRKIVRQGNRY